jgi:D-sedoheptulose 7-phosphate isomerase
VAMSISAGAKPLARVPSQNIPVTPVGPVPHGPFARHVEELAEICRLAATCEHDVAVAADLLADALAQGGTIFSCGNGGSATDAAHFTAELVGRMVSERDPLRGVNLAADPAVLTALGNDYGYDQVFARAVDGIARTGDALLGISTSGRSDNVLLALEAAARRGVPTVLLTGASAPAPLAADVVIRIPSTATPHIQELHTAVIHVLCLEIEARLGLPTS